MGEHGASIHLGNFSPDASDRQVPGESLKPVDVFGTKRVGITQCSFQVRTTDRMKASDGIFAEEGRWKVSQDERSEAISQSQVFMFEKGQDNRKVQTHFAFDQSSEWCGGESTPLIGIHLS